MQVKPGSSGGGSGQPDPRSSSRTGKSTLQMRLCLAPPSFCRDVRNMGDFTLRWCCAWREQAGPRCWWRAPACALPSSMNVARGLGPQRCDTWSRLESSSCPPGSDEWSRKREPRSVGPAWDQPGCPPRVQQQPQGFPLEARWGWGPKSLVAP